MYTGIGIAKGIETTHNNRYLLVKHGDHGWS